MSASSVSLRVSARAPKTINGISFPRHLDPLPGHQGATDNVLTTMGSVTAIVWCLCVNDQYTVDGSAFKVPLEDARTIVDLKKAVKKKKPISLKGFDAHHLALWRCTDPSNIGDGEDPELLQAQVKDAVKNHKLERLGSRQEIAALRLTEDDMLLVQIPGRKHNSEGRVKRHHSTQELHSIELDTRKRNKLATESPSTNAKLAHYRKLQRDPTQNILDDRLTPDGFVPPISLLYDGFGLFFDIIDGRDDVPGVSEVNTFKMTKEVDEFAESMCQFYASEDDRWTEGVDCLNKIFGSPKDGLPSSRIFSNAHSIGYCTGPHQVSSVIAIFNKSIIGLQTLPEIELVSHLAESQRVAMACLAKEGIFYGWRIPCLGIVVVGYEVRFCAILTLGPKFRLVSLTPSISCIRTASDGRERKALRTAFIAASVLQSRIHADVNPHLSTPSPVIYHDFEPPYLPAINRIGTFEIRDLELWHKPHPYRYVYQAKDASGNPILVKFSPRYSPELHRFCAKRGHAPALLACERLPGGWYGIAMEYLQNVEPISLSPNLERYHTKWEMHMRMLLLAFHSENLVHGDLRDANILCDPQGRMSVIDFDWGGKEGTVFYPTSDLHPELLEGRSSDSLTITEEDDMRVLDITFRKVEQNLMVRSP